MAKVLRISSDTRDELLKAVRDLVDAGDGAGVLRIYSGTQPAGPDTAVTDQTLLAELTLGDPSAPDPSTPGELTFNALTRDEAANATGTASWARVLDSDGNAIFDCNVGVSDEVLVLNTVNLVVNGPVEISAFKLTMPAG